MVAAVRGAGVADGDVRSILQAESDEQMKLMGSPNQMEAVAAGMQRRPARFAERKQKIMEATLRQLEGTRGEELFRQEF